jgi:hypothetical protein
VVAARVARSPYGFALVVANDGTLLGRLRKAALDADLSARAEHVMEAGPSTVRPDRPLAELVERLRRRGWHTRSSPLPMASCSAWSNGPIWRHGLPASHDIGVGWRPDDAPRPVRG